MRWMRPACRWGGHQLRISAAANGKQRQLAILGDDGRSTFASISIELERRVRVRERVERRLDFDPLRVVGSRDGGRINKAALGTDLGEGVVCDKDC